MTFNWIHYRELNPDLTINGLTTEQTFTYHYNTIGINENRKINIYMEYPDFNWEQYRENYNDLKKALTNKKDFENHWLVSGRNEKRLYTHPVYIKYPDFNWEQYRENYIDLFNTFNDNKMSYENHWIKSGVTEKRTYYMITDKLEFIIYSTKWTINVGLSLSNLLNQLNISNIVVYNITQEDININNLKPHQYFIILCPQTLNKIFPSPNKYIIYQLEQVAASNHIDIIYNNRIAKSLITFDYSNNNINILITRNILLTNKIVYQPIPITIDQNIIIDANNNIYDLLFIGALNSRRKNILNELQKKYTIKIVTDVFGDDFYNIVKKSKIIINLHYYNNNSILEIPRINDCLLYNKLVISELPSKEDIININIYKDIVVFIPIILSDLSNINNLYNMIDKYNINDNYNSHIMKNISFIETIQNKSFDLLKSTLIRCNLIKNNVIKSSVIKNSVIKSSVIKSNMIKNSVIKNNVIEYTIKNKTHWRKYCNDNMNYMNILDIPSNITSNSNINAVLIEFRIMDNLEFVIKNCIIKLKNKCCYTVVCGNLNYNYIENINKKLNGVLNIIKLEYDNIDVNTYSMILTSISFWENLMGDYILIYQEDSCVFKDNIEDFICFDYIGAPWPLTQNDNIKCVGNGGFSLRNKNKMIEVIRYIDPLKLEYNSSTTEYMKNAGITFPPEDVYFSKAMLDYNIGIVADYNTALTFSIESIYNTDSFGGHNFWLNGNCIDILNQKVIIKFKPNENKIYEHRGGWNTILSNLKTNNFYSDDSIYNFIDIIEEYFLWRTDYKLLNKWAGFIHLTPNTPEYLVNCDISKIFNNVNFIKSLKYCFAIFTLSNYMKKYMEKQFILLKLNIPVIFVKHPIDMNVPLFDIMKYIDNPNKMIIQIGQQLRIMSSIYRIKYNNHKPIWLTGTKNFNNIKHILNNEMKYLGVKINMNNVEMKYIEDFNTYDMMLSQNIVFVNLHDASANNTVIECIVRNTPIIINRIESVVEYLGEEYPLYYDNIMEVEMLLTVDNIIKAHEYLVKMNKDDLNFDHFNNILFNSIYQYINSV